MDKQSPRPAAVALTLAALIVPLVLSAFTTWVFSTIASPEEGVIALLDREPAVASRTMRDECQKADRAAANEGVSH
jgi:hypothetical protein